MKRGQHIGKIVISNDEQKDVQVPVKPVMRKLRLRSDVTYLIVGGLKGLCGSIAAHLAQHGARHIAVISRSGLDDEVSVKRLSRIMRLISAKSLMQRAILGIWILSVIFSGLPSPEAPVLYKERWICE
jgi:hypothetical protein